MRNDCWKLAEAVLPISDRVLLYGPPGTGKTHIAQRHGLKSYQKVYSMYMTEYTPVSEPRGSIYPILVNGERKFEWIDGPALEAYRNGHRLVVNEINQMSDDCITFMLALLDDRAVSRITLPNGDVVRPHPDFSVVATMNVEPSYLLEALKDRFPITIHIDKPNPQAVSSLPKDLQEPAMRTATLEDGRRVGMRQWLAFAELRDLHGMDTEIAAEACFGLQANEIAYALKMGETSEAYRS